MGLARIVGVGAGLAAGVVSAARPASAASKAPEPSVEMVLVGVAMIVGYFLPGLVAKIRRHPSSDAILLLNLLLGWTAIVWVGALVWAMTSTGREPASAVKVCPRCAETVKRAALVCRFCGHRFEG